MNLVLFPDAALDDTLPLGAPHPNPRHDEHAIVPAPYCVTVRDCCALATDMAPDMGSVGPDRLLGDFALEASVDALAVCLAISCFQPIEDDTYQRSPFRMWLRRKPVPPHPTRIAFRAVDRAPQELVRLHNGVAERILDGGVVDVEAGARVNLGAPSEFALARLVPTEAGTVAHLAVGLPRLPDLASLRDWRLRALTTLCETYKVGNPLRCPVPTFEEVMRHPMWIRRIVTEVLA